jgi:ribonuclease HI
VTLLKTDGSYTTSSSDTLDVYLETFFPRLDPEIPVVPPVGHEPVEVEDHVVSPDRVRWALSSFDSFKAAGPDDVSPAHLQRGGAKLHQALQVLYIGSLKFGWIPTCWRDARVVFIPKPGRTDVFNPKAKRPICLTSFLLKGLERLVDWQLRGTTLMERPLCKFQFAYSAGKSSEAALHYLVSRIEKALEAGDMALGVFLDAQGAFDNIPHFSVSEALTRFRVMPIYHRWIMSMLANRKVTANLLDAVRTISVERGTPQGGVLSPLLWNMVIDDLLVILQRLLALILGFADDVGLLQVGSHCDTIRGTTQVALNTVERWCKENHLRLNPAKTELVMFTLKNRWKMKPLFLCGQELIFHDHVKYLGVILDQRLTWGKHVQFAATKAMKVFSACRRAVGKRWGLSPRAMRWVYNAVVLPMLTYGCIVWGKAAEIETHLKRLRSVQRQACIGITGAMRSAPTASLEILTGLLPIDLGIRKEALSAYHRLKVAAQWRTWQLKARPLQRCSHMEWIQERSNVIPVMWMPSDSMTPRMLFERYFETQIASREDWQTRALSTAPEDGYNCFTDGSRHHDFSGAGALVVPSPNGEGERWEGKLPLGRHGTVFQAEVVGVTMSSEHLYDQNVTNESIRFFSDSSACIKALVNPKVRSRLVEECLLSLNRLGRHNQVTLEWVPGHTGVQGNEEADLLAKEAATKCEGPEPFVPVPRACVRMGILRYLREVHERRWSATTEYRHSRLLLPRLPSVSWVEGFLGLRRSEIWMVTALVTGHATLMGHLHRIGVAESPLCGRCREEEETPFHVLVECPQYGAARLAVFNQNWMNLPTLRETKLSSWVEFAKKTKLFDRRFAS